jgi:multicomponent Na+:H+ antiporter subunit A
MRRHLVSLIPLALFAATLLFAPAGGGVRILELPFGASEELGIRLSFRLDGLSILFALLITGIGALVYVYGGTYLADRRDLPRFWAYLTLFMVSMLGLTLSENLIALFVFWELTSISSYLLIGIDHERQEARDAALQALLVTGGGGMALLAGFVLLGSIAGSFELSTILAQGDAIRAHAHYVPALLLILLGAFTKSAQVPFHFWLPSAMEAPTPVSAYLHSATMVKAGVYLLARLSPALAGTEEWTTIVTVAGALTMVAGALFAVMATDLKQILAYTTMSALGSMVMLLGLGTPAAVQAMIVYLFAHALYKAALFMVAGIVDHEAGTRDVTRLGGLRRAMPLTATAAIAGAISLASFGPVLSFAAKEMVTAAIGGAGPWRVPLEIAVYGSAILLAASAALIAVKPFFGGGQAIPPVRDRQDCLSSTVHDPAAAMWVPPLLLAAMGILIAFFPHQIAEALLGPAAGAVHAAAAPLTVVLWHGVNAPLLLAAAATAAGLLLYRLRDRWSGLAAAAGRVTVLHAAAWYRGLLRTMVAVATWQTRVLQNGYLRVYVMVILLTLVTLLLAAKIHGGGVTFAVHRGDFAVYEVAVAVLIVAASLAAASSRTRLGSIAALGAVGYSVAVTYIIFSAPDLAMTQFVVETLTVILYVLVLYRLPKYNLLTKAGERVRDVIICTVFGSVMAALVMAAQSVRVDPTLASFFETNSLPKGHGRNIVNVMLVDFRAFDTMGEIAVIGIAAVGVYALLHARAAERP